MPELVQRNRNFAKKSTNLSTIEIKPSDLKAGIAKLALIIPPNAVISDIYYMCTFNHDAGAITIQSIDQQTGPNGIIDITDSQNTVGVKGQLLPTKISAIKKTYLQISTANTMTVGSFTVCILYTEPRLLLGKYTDAIPHLHDRNVTVAPPPVVTVLGSNPLSIFELTAFTDPGATAVNYLGSALPITVGGDFVDVDTIGTYLVSYSATDSFNQTTTEFRTVQVVANDAPIITLIGPNPAETVEGQNYVDQGATATDTEDGVLTVNEVSNNVDINIPGTYQIVYSAADSGGKISTVTRTVHVIADLTPVITLLGNNPDTVTQQQQTFIYWRMVSVRKAGGYTSVVKEFTILDQQGNNLVDYNQFEDNLGGGGADITRLSNGILELGSGQTGDIGLYLNSSLDPNDDKFFKSTNHDIQGDVDILFAGYTTDGGGGDPEARIQIGVGTADYLMGPGADANIMSNLINDIVWTDLMVIPTSATQSVKLDQATVNIPSIPNATLVPYTDPGATATDTEDGDLTGSIATTGTVDLTTVGSYTITYSVTDSNGSTTTADRTVNVVTNAAPVITLNGSATVSQTEGNTYTDLGATALDAEDGDITASIVVGGDVVDPNTPGSYSVTYDVTDSNGTPAPTVTRTVDILSDQIPIITILGNNNIDITQGDAYVDAGATANDNEDGDITASIVTGGTVDVNTLGSYQITYDVTDSFGNEATQVTRTINVVADQAPVITLIGSANVDILQGPTNLETTLVDEFTSPIEDSWVVQKGLAATSGGKLNLLEDQADSTQEAILESKGKFIGTSDFILEAVIDSQTATNITHFSFGFGGASGNAVRVTRDGGNVTVFNSSGGSGQGEVLTGVVYPFTVRLVKVGSSQTVQYKSAGAPGFTTLTSGGSPITRTTSGSDSPLRLTKTVQGNTTDQEILLESVTVVQGSLSTDPYVDAGATASDNEDGDITADISTVSTVDQTTIGSYSVTYDVTDSGGNPAPTVTRTVNVV